MEKEAYVEAWRNRKGIHYTVRLYDDDGRKRGLMEQLLMLAVVMITGETQDWMMSKGQRDLLERKVAEIETAIIIVKEHEINSYRQFLHLRFVEDDDVRRQLAVLQPFIKSVLDTEEFRKLVEKCYMQEHERDFNTDYTIKRAQEIDDGNNRENTR